MDSAHDLCGLDWVGQITLIETYKDDALILPEWWKDRGESQWYMVNLTVAARETVAFERIWSACPPGQHLGWVERGGV